MALTYNSIDLRGVAAEPIIEEILFENKTISQDLVTFETDIKAETIFTEAAASATMQAYVCGEPTAAGSLDAFDTVVTPVKVMYYDEFCPDNIRFSRFKRDMKPGAWNDFSDEFEKVIIGGVYSKNVSRDAEVKFWNNVTTATKTAVSGLTTGATSASVSTQEKALVAATSVGQFDGVVQRMIYNSSNASHTAAVGGRIRVVGTTIDASNIKAEYDKVYAAIPAEVLNSGSLPYIYAPEAHMQLINIFNNNVANYKDAFAVSDDKKSYFFNGLEIKFVPVPANTMIAAKKEHIIWATDLLSDLTTIKLEKIAANREDWFYKNVMTMTSHVVNQAFNVLYVG